MEAKNCEVDDSFWAFDFRCYMYYFAVTLRIIYFHWITLGILVLIILISIFGKIKGNYRWFILNQAIWDACIVYDFFCNSGYGFGVKCFYRVFLSYPTWKLILFTSLNTIFRKNSYSALFLLTFSRFLCLYFGDFYENITKKFRIFYFIFFVTLIFLSITFLLSAFQSISTNRLLQLTAVCTNPNTSLYDALDTNCAQDVIHDDFMYNFFHHGQIILDKIDKGKGPACIIGALIPSLLIVRKVTSQFKFQFNKNRKDFYGSLRIAVVLALQWFFNAVILILETLQTIYSLEEDDDKDNYSFLSLFKGPYAFSNVQTFRQIRVFLECVIVLTVMTGYREAIFKLIKWIFHRFKRQQFRTSPGVSGVRSSSGIIFVNQR